MSQALPSAEDIETRFDVLQSTLADQWQLIGGFNQEVQTMVVVPSLSLDFDCPASILQAYEERFLFLLLLLRKPRARIVYVTSQPIQPDIVDYYLSLLPGVIPSHARKRLVMLPVQDGSVRPLTEKILERPRLIARIRGLIGDPARAHMIPYNTTALERELAVRLGIPMYGADPKHFPLGTKTGCRRVFAEVGVRHPQGVEDLHDLAGVAAAIRSMRTRAPEIAQVLVKLNDGVSGAGNALVDLVGLPAPGTADEDAAVLARLRAMRFEWEEETLDSYLAKLTAGGGVVEERIVGESFRSPSVQLRVTPTGEVEVLSTHDQILGGPSGQSFLGCRFPADPRYAATIAREARKIGERLAHVGVIGRFAVDFVVVSSGDGPWQAYAIEINLRKGGTTHPYLTLEFLTGGSYDAEAGVFRAPDGRNKFYVATDHMEATELRQLTPDDVFDCAIRHGLHFTQATQTGVVFHMLTSITEHGSCGLTAVADSPAEAEAIYQRTGALLRAEGAA